MTGLRVFLAALVVAAMPFAVAPPAHAQFFEPRYSPPTYRQQPRRLPGTGEYIPQYDREYVTPRRQYVPEQRARPRERGFFERLFGLPIRGRRTAPPMPADGDRGGGGGGGGGSQDSDVAAAPKKVVPKTIFVAVMGDSFAQDLAPGLSDALSERPEVGFVREIRPGVGFLKETDKTWRMVADGILARDPPVNAAVIFLGPNDDPPPKKKKTADDTEVPEVTTASPWMDQYAAKVDDLALAFRQKGIPLIWVGLPPVEDPAAMADNLFLNDLVRQRVTALGGTFVDTWEGFVNEEDEFAAQGPNVEGRVVRLRTADGIHFTRAGARKIGHSVELELRTILAPKDSGDAVADLTVDPGAPTVPGSSRILMLGQAPRTPGALLVPPSKTGEKKAEFNPGVLAGTEGAAPAAPAASAAASDSTLVSGAAVAPKPGRADDFAWPATAAN